MTRPVYDFRRQVKAFVEHGLWGGRRRFGACAAIGFADAREGLVAGVIYHNYEPDSGVIEISAYSSRRDWLVKSHLKTIFDYPFNQLDLRLVIARCGEKNERVRRIWKVLGASEAVIPELRGSSEAEIVLLLHRRNWNQSPFMRKRHG